jgi:hypothetical protein
MLAIRGVPAGTASTSLLAAKATGLSTRPLAKSMLGSLRFAEANTSGLTPCSIWAASTSDPAKENRARPGANCSP